MSDEVLRQSFYCVIPTEIFTDHRLSLQAKVLYGVITSLTNTTGYCWAKNQYLADCMDIGERQVRRYLEELKAQDYVYIEMLDGERHLYIKRPLYMERQYSTKPELLEEVKNIVDETPYEWIMELWNRFLGGDLAKVSAMTPQRKKVFKARYKEHPDNDFWFELFSKTIKDSAFLMGITTSWKATFDWVMNPRNLQKIIDGNYAKTTPKTKTETPVELKWQEFCRNLGRGQQDPVLKKVASKMDTYNMRRMSPSQLQFQRNGFVSLYNNFLQEVTA